MMVSSEKFSRGAKRAKWYHRSSVKEDPWISLSDHHDAIRDGSILYGEGSFKGSDHLKAVVEHDGANVWIYVE